MSLSRGTALHVVCPNCDATIDPEEINIKLGVAKCVTCQSVFSFADQVPPADSGAPVPAARAEVPLPSGIRVEQWGHELCLARRWFTPAVLFLLFFCVAWDGFLVFWYSMAFSDANTPWIMIVFPVAHVAIGIGLTYFTIASLLNTTRIRVANGQLSVRHGPLPWLGSCDISVDDIEQIFCSEKTKHGENGSHTFYGVNAMLTDGRKIKLVSGLSEADQALYIEQTIEDHLHIPDRPVGGEMRR